MTTYKTGQLVELAVIILNPQLIFIISYLNHSQILLNLSQYFSWPGGEIHTFIPQKAELLWLLCPAQTVVAMSAHSCLLLNMEAKQALR